MTSRVVAAAFAGLLLAGARLVAHHEILAKFDDHKPVTLNGIVTLVDWRNPHVHVFMNVTDAERGRQLGDRARGPDRPGTQRLVARDAAARRPHPRRRHRRPERQPPGVGQFRGDAGDRQGRLQRHADAAALRRSNRGRRRGGPIASRVWARAQGGSHGILGVPERHRARRRQQRRQDRHPDGHLGPAEEHRRRAESGADAAVGAAALHRAAAAVSAGRPDVSELQTAGRVRVSFSSRTASSSSRIAIASGSSC